MNQNIKVNDAVKCENAHGKNCRCQCGGKLHGARRGSVGNLPVNDPHSPSSQCPHCGGEGNLNAYDTKSLQFERRMCPACKGTGLVVLPKTMQRIDKKEAGYGYQAG